MFLDLAQYLDLAIATATNIGAIYLTVVMLCWTRRLRHSRTSLRPLIFSLALAKFALWFWTLSNIVNIIAADNNLPVATLPARFLWLFVVGVQVWVTTLVRPAPILPDSLDTEMDRDGRLVLIVEDNEALARVYRRSLEQVGINAEFVTSGRDALTIIGIEQPRLIMVDLGLPDMDGVALAERARAAGYKGTIIAISGAAGLIDAQKLGATFAQIVQKPIRPVELVGLVHQWGGNIPKR